MGSFRNPSVGVHTFSSSQFEKGDLDQISTGVAAGAGMIVFIVYLVRGLFSSGRLGTGIGSVARR